MIPSTHASQSGYAYGAWIACSGVSMTAVPMRTREAHIRQALASTLTERRYKLFHSLRIPTTWRGRLARSLNLTS